MSFEVVGICLGKLLEGSLSVLGAGKGEQTKHLYEFGPFRLDSDERLLMRGAEVVQLMPKAFDLLLALVENPGRLQEKEELLRRVWPDTFVEEANLSYNISFIRKALADGEDGQRYIETVPKRGYRFVAEVRKVSLSSSPSIESPVGPKEQPAKPVAGLATEEIARPSETADEGQPASQSRASVDNRRRPFLLWLSGIVAALVVSVAAWFIWSGDPGHLAPTIPLPLTSYLGWEGAPSFSPDGTQIAFCWNGEKQDNFDIYIKLIGSGGQSRLTNHSSVEKSPVWSPDGRWIAFQRWLEPGRIALVLKPPIGGPERILTELNSSDLMHFKYPSDRDMAWHPSSAFIVVPERIGVGGPHALFAVSVETGGKRRLTSPPATWPGDRDPSFSFDGLHLAFSRARSGQLREIYVLDLLESLVPKGEPRQLTFIEQRISAPVWTPDGREILFVSGPQHRVGLWRMAAAGNRKPERLPFATEGAGFPAISSERRRLAYLHNSFDVNIWKLELPLQGQQTVPINLVSSTRVDDKPQYSPDGKRIAFSSYRSGSPEIWVCNSDGSDWVQLTSLNAASTTGPHWSPDGRRIVFQTNKTGSSDLFVVSPDGGTPTQLTNSPAHESAATFSRDGKWIYFTSDRSGEAQIWKIPSEGGAALPVNRMPGCVPHESPDGEVVYYLVGSEPNRQLRRISIKDGEEKEVLPSVYAQNFAVVASGIYFIPNPDAAGRFTIHYMNFATGKISLIAQTQKEVMYGFSVSPDERTILYTQVDQEGSDLMLVENFR